MAEHRSGPGIADPADEVHDDDELADVLAAELQRYATGVVPVLERPADAGPGRRAVPASAPPEVERGRRAAPHPAEGAAAVPDRPVRDVVALPGAEEGSAFLRRRRLEEAPAATPAPAASAASVTALHAAEPPIRRRSGFRPPALAAPPAPVTPLERVLPTRPVALPEATASLLEEIVAEADGAARPDGLVLPPTAPTRLPPQPAPARNPPVREPVAVVADRDPSRRTPTPAATEPPLPVRHRPGTAEVPAALVDVPAASDGSAPADGLGVDGTAPLSDPLRTTGPLAVPRPLYSDWEQSLRSIGRPRSPWDDDGSPLVGGAPVDAPTVAMFVQGTGPVTATPADAIGPDGGDDTVLHEDPQPPTGRIRRSGRRRAAAAADEAQPTAPDAPAPMAIVPDDAPDDEGIDDVEPPHPQISAATTGAIDLPLAEPRPRTGPVLVERVRTAILQLPVVPDSPTGTGAAAIAGRWIGAFVSPLLLLVAFGAATAGAGPASAVLVLAGVLAALPAAARSAAWAATAQPEDQEESAVLGRPGGAVAAAVLLVARIGGGALAVFAIASTLSAWIARTGALGGSASGSAVASAAVVGVVALAVAALPVRAAGALVQVLGALGVIGTILLVLLLAPTSAGAAGPGGGAVAAAAAGFAAVGLVLVLCGADVVRWRTDLVGPRGAAAGTVVGAAAGVVALVVGLLVAAGAEGDPADALAGALSDGSAADLAGPLAVVLLGAALVLPVLLLRSAGSAAARLLGQGGSSRLGVLAAGLLAVAGAFGLLAAGLDVGGAAAALGGILGVPVAAWAGVRTLARPGGRAAPAIAGAVAAVVVGWSLSDGLLPSLRSPVLDLLGVAGASGLRGGPAAGLLVAFVIGLLAAIVARAGARPAAGRPATADTVEG